MDQLSARPSRKKRKGKKGGNIYKPARKHSND
jgi:hypothetical protein